MTWKPFWCGRDGRSPTSHRIGDAVAIGAVLLGRITIEGVGGRTSYAACMSRISRGAGPHDECDAVALDARRLHPVRLTRQLKFVESVTILEPIRLLDPRTVRN